jgi:carbohydrate-selective porin OprB
LEEHGISAQVALVVDWSKNFRGGACSRGSVSRQLFKSSVTLDSDKSLGWKGGTAYASLYYHAGQHGGDHTGDAQGFSNIDAPSRTYLYELWLQQELLRGKLRLKAGRVDANTEFAVVENGADFLNSSMGYSPTILGFATYPQPRPSLNVFYQATRHIYAKAGLYDTAGAGAMPVAEAGRNWSITSNELEGRLGAGL